MPGPAMGDTISTPAEPPKPSAYTAAAATKKPTSSRAMKLGGKGKDVASFVDQLKLEGENVMSQEMSAKQPSAPLAKASAAAVPQRLDTESVHAKLEEKLTVICKRDGALEAMELAGMLTLRISDDQFGRVKLKLPDPGQQGRAAAGPPQPRQGAPQAEEPGQALPREHGRGRPQVEVTDPGRGHHHAFK